MAGARALVETRPASVSLECDCAFETRARTLCISSLHAHRRDRLYVSRSRISLTTVSKLQQTSAKLKRQTQTTHRPHSLLLALARLRPRCPLRLDRLRRRPFGQPRPHLGLRPRSATLLYVARDLLFLQRVDENRTGTAASLIVTFIPASFPPPPRASWPRPHRSRA